MAVNLIVPSFIKAGRHTINITDISCIEERSRQSNGMVAVLYLKSGGERDLTAGEYAYLQKHLPMFVDYR